MSSSSYRNLCLATSNGECVACGDSEKVVAHHIDGDRYNDDPDNLVPMCPSCHRSVHMNRSGYGEWYEKLNPDAQRAFAGNIKEDRKSRTFYLHDAIIDELETEYRRLGYEFGFDIKKGKHYYPLVVALGLKELERVSEEEIVEFLDLFEEMDRRQVDQTEFR
jgi:hypothetical protein